MNKNIFYYQDEKANLPLILKQKLNMANVMSKMEQMVDFKIKEEEGEEMEETEEEEECEVCCLIECACATCKCCEARPCQGMWTRPSAAKVRRVP